MVVRAMKDYRIHETEHIRGGNRKRITIQNTRMHANKQNSERAKVSASTLNTLSNPLARLCKLTNLQPREISINTSFKGFFKTTTGEGELGEVEAGELSQDVMCERRIKENN